MTPRPNSRTTSREQAAARGPERFSLPVVPVQPPSTGQALLAGLALIALLVLVPVVLWTFTGPPPIPTGLPSSSELTQPISAGAVFAVLRAVVWLAWLQFAVCTLVETRAIVEDRGLPRPVPLSGPTQALARALVSTLLVGATFIGTTGAASAASAAPIGAAPMAASQTVASETAQDTDGVGGVEQAQPGTSRSGDEHEAAAPTMEHVPGVPASMTDVIGRKVVIVQPPDGAYHDNLWDIAERHLGDGRRWKEIHALNKERVQPDGQKIVLGRLIQPGWVMVMPEDARGVVRVKAAPATQVEEQQPAPAAPEPADHGEAPEGVQVPGLALGGLIAATLLGALAAERRRRRGSAPGDEDLETEVALHVGAEPERATLLDAALRSLAAQCRDESRSLPQVYAVTVDDEAVELHLAPPLATAPGRWSVHDDGARWKLAVADSDDATDGPAPYPALVCLGRADNGRDVLLDLEALGGVLSLDGSGAVAREVASAVAVQMAHLPWVDDHTVHTHALSPALQAVAGPALTAVDDVDDLIQRWSAEPGRRPASDVLSGRLRTAGTSAAHHLVLGAAVGPGESTRLAALTRDTDRGVAVVSAVPFTGARWTATVDDTGRLRVPLLDIEVQAVRVTDQHAAELAELFAHARADAPAVTDDRVPVPRPPRPDDDARWNLAQVRLGVMGDLVLRVPGSLDPARLELATEVVVMIALQRTPVHPSVVAASVWPGGVTPQVRDATLARVRDWLGTDPDGNHLLREDDEGRLSLAPGVVVDWYAFCSLVQRSRASSPEREADLLRRALGLVRGEFMESRPSRRYSWLPRTRTEQQVQALVTDSALRLVDLSLPSDPDSAAEACRAGLRTVPTSQELWRALLRAESHRPDGPGSPGAIREMTVALNEVGAPWDAETAALVEELVPGASSAAGETA